MKFSDTTAKSGIIQLSETLCKLGDGGISNDATLLKQFTNYVNMAYWEVFMAQLSVDSRWKADDFNYTDYPEAPINLVDDQRDYELPVAATGDNIATLLRVNKVWVLDSQGNRMEIQPLAPEDDEFDGKGFPQNYRLHGKSIRLDPRPNTSSVTATGGLIVQFQRIPDPFVSTDTTQQPGFMGTYHDLLPLRASAWYLLPTNPQLATAYEDRFLRRLELFKRDVSRGDDNSPAKIVPEMINHR